MRLWRFAACTLALGAASCSVGPDYVRPTPDVPASYRGSEEAALPAGPRSLGDAPWTDVFLDEALASLLRTALRDSYDARLAANRILQAEQQVAIVRASFFPSAGAGADASRSRSNIGNMLPGDPNVIQNAYSVTASATWELDVWGKVRRQTEAARAAFLAEEDNRSLVLQTLVASVAKAYYQLRELDDELELSRRTLASRQESLRLVQLRQAGGVSNMVEVRQAQSLVYQAAATIPQLLLQIEQTENQLSILTGAYPAAIPRGRRLTEQNLTAALPEGLPSQLLERRPDVRHAEQLVVAANANIGVAKAAFFPSISLTASNATASDALDGLFKKSSAVWSVGGGLFQPLFQGGRLVATYRLAGLQNEEAVLVYGQTVQQAFREVSDALAGYRRVREVRVQQEKLADTLVDETRLANIRYKGGVTAYLEVLDAERQAYDAQRGLCQARLGELLSVVELYRALGGGWQPPQAPVAAAAR